MNKLWVDVATTPWELARVRKVFTVLFASKIVEAQSEPWKAIDPFSQVQRLVLLAIQDGFANRLHFRLRAGRTAPEHATGAHVDARTRSRHQLLEPERGGPAGPGPDPGLAFLAGEAWRPLAREAGGAGSCRTRATARRSLQLRTTRLATFDRTGNFCSLSASSSRSGPVPRMRNFGLPKTSGCSTAWGQTCKMIELPLTTPPLLPRGTSSSHWRICQRNQFPPARPTARSRS